MAFNATSTTFFNNLNVSEESAKRAEAIKTTTKAYTDYMVKKATLQGEVLTAKAQLGTVEAELQGSRTLASIEATSYKSPDAFINDVLETTILETENMSRKDLAVKNVAKAQKRLELLTTWGQAMGFED